MTTPAHSRHNGPQAPQHPVIPPSGGGDGLALVNAEDALRKANVTSAMDLLRVVLAAGGVTVYAAGDQLLINPAIFEAAGVTLQRTGAI